MKTIEILQTFKHAGQTFHKNDRRSVTPEDAGYFCGVGWARDVTGELVTGTAVADVTLEVQDVFHNTAAPTINT